MLSTECLLILALQGLQRVRRRIGIVCSKGHTPDERSAWVSKCMGTISIWSPRPQLHAALLVGYTPELLKRLSKSRYLTHPVYKLEGNDGNEKEIESPLTHRKDYG